jgi:predicted permease
MTSRKRALDGLAADLRDHIERETQDNLDRGLSPDEAHRQAMLAIGNVAIATEDARAVWVRPWLDQTRQDVRYALRMLRRNPGFAAAAILTLALGIGANTAIFSLVDAIMLRTIAVQAPEDLYFIAHGSTRPGPSSNYPYFERIRARTDLFTGATTYVGGTFKVSIGDSTEMTRGQFVSGNYHAVLGVPMALGRGFASEDDRQSGGALVAVISDSYWNQRFGRDRQILGRTLMIDRRPFSIVGVTAPGFDGFDPGTRPDVTLPMAVRVLDAPKVLNDHGTWGDPPVVARLKDGVTKAQASAAVDALFQQYVSEPENTWLKTIPGSDHIRASLQPAGRGTMDLRDRYSGSLQVLTAMVGVVLLIACANVANLLVARGMARAREVAVRMSIGASRLRLIRQFVMESVLLALIGGALGFVLARMSLASIVALVASGPEPVLLNLQPNASVLTFTVAVSLLTGILFGLAPGLGCTRVNLTPALKTAGSRIGPSSRRRPIREVVVAAQIGLCVVLVAGAGLLGRTLRNLETRDTGFNRSNLLLFSLDARRTSFPVEQVPRLCDDLIEEVVRRGEVESGSCSRNIPVNSRGNARPLEVPGAKPQPQNARQVFTNMVTPGYFRTLGIAVAGGRVFDAHDSAKAEHVAVVNRALVRFFFGSENPIGRRVHFFQSDANPMTIVGIVEDAAQRSLREEAPMTIYTPLAQLSEPEGLVTVALRTPHDPVAVARSARAEVRALGTAVVVSNVRTMEQQIGFTLVRERLLAMLSSAFGALALLLSCIGLYGVISYDVTRRLRDLGVRLALGARPLDVLRQVVGRALAVSAIGVAAGVVVALSATRVLSGVLFGIAPRDPLTLVSAAGMLLLTGLIASYVPARRASRLNPVVVLRTE